MSTRRGDASSPRPGNLYPPDLRQGLTYEHACREDYRREDSTEVGAARGGFGRAAVAHGVNGPRSSGPGGRGRCGGRGTPGGRGRLGASDGAGLDAGLGALGLGYLECHGVQIGHCGLVLCMDGGKWRHRAGGSIQEIFHRGPVPSGGCGAPVNDRSEGGRWDAVDVSGPLPYVGRTALTRAYAL